MDTSEKVSAVIYSNTDDLPQALQEGLMLITNVDTQECYECQVCPKSMTGCIPAQAHLQGSPHMKALQNYLHTQRINASMVKLSIDGADGTSSPALTPGNRSFPSSARSQSPSFPSKSSDTVQSACSRGIVAVEMVLNQKVFTCILCSIPCTGEIPMKQHLLGVPHLKKQRELNSSGRTTLVARPETNSYESDSNLPATRMNSLSCKVAQSAVPLETDSYCSSSNSSFAEQPAPPANSDDPIQSALNSDIVTRPLGGDPSHLFCNICHKSCTGETPMKQHLRGDLHQKNLRAKGLFVGSQQRSIVTPTYNPENVNKSFTSPSQVQSSSDSYKDVLQSAKDKGIVIETAAAFECLICSAKCTGVVPMTEHLHGETHFKKLRDQINYQQFMLKTPSNGDSTSLCPTSPARDTSSDTTNLSPVLSSSSPDVVASSLQYGHNDHDNPDSVSQTVSSTKENTGCLSIPSYNVPNTTKEVKIYTSVHPLDDLFD